MTSIFGKIGQGLEHIGQQIGDEVQNFVSGDPKADPRKFSNGAPVQSQSSSSVPGVPGQGTSGYTGFSSSPSLPIAGAPMGTLPPGMSQDQATQIYNAAMSNPDLSGVIKSIGGDIGSVVGAIGSALGGFITGGDRNPDGSINWTKLLSNAAGDIGGFLKDHAKDIVNGLSAYEQYQRQNKADTYLNQALNGIPGTDYKGAIAEYSAKQPLRDAGQAGMLSPHANTPDLSSLNAQGQQGKTLQASLPIANPAQAQGMTNLRNLAGPQSGNPFGKSLPIAQGPTTPVMPPVTPSQPGAPQQSAPSLPIAPQPPMVNPMLPTLPGGAKPGQLKLPPVGPPNTGLPPAPLASS